MTGKSGNRIKNKYVKRPNGWNFVFFFPRFIFLRRWYYNRNQREEPIEESSGHYVVRDGSLIIQNVEENDAGSYICAASNSEGRETLEIRLTVSAPLSVHVQPAIQTVDLGKSAYLVINHHRHRFGSEDK
ncbi:hypothetical protein P5V15_008973 [Pogonomyrmex californicus]